MICIQNCHCILGEPHSHIEKHADFRRNIFIPDDFSSDQMEDIKTALNEWTEKTNYSVQFNIFEHYDKRIMKLLPYREGNIVILTIPPETPIVVNMEKEMETGNIILGLWVANDSIPTIYIVSSRIYDRMTYTAVILHEVGHAMGLDHNPNEASVMYKSQDKSSKHLMPTDIAAFCHIHYCNNESN